MWRARRKFKEGTLDHVVLLRVAVTYQVCTEDVIETYTNLMVITKSWSMAYAATLGMGRRLSSMVMWIQCNSLPWEEEQRLAYP